MACRDTPTCNVWLTLLHGNGVSVKRHGNSTVEFTPLMGEQVLIVSNPE